MTVHRYSREYHNPSGQSPNTPMVHDYDRTRPTSAPGATLTRRGQCIHGYMVTAAGCKCRTCDQCPACHRYLPAGTEHQMPA